MRFTSGSWCHVPRNITLYGVLCVFLWTYCIYLYGNAWPTVPLPARFFQASYYTDYSINENRIGSKIGKHLEWSEATEVPEVVTTTETRAWTDEAPETENERKTSEPFRNDHAACTIPKLNPFDTSILQFVQKPTPANCEKDHPLLFKTDFNSTLIQVQDPEKFGYYDCCYKVFQRKKKDEQVKISQECIEVGVKTIIPDGIEFISVYCARLENGTEIRVPVDMFGFVHLKPEVEKRAKELTKVKEGHRQVNVVILGIDAVSHMNFIRTMPQSYNYLTKELNAVGMQGYTKVGDNTFPNIVPATTGMTVEEIENGCWKGKGGFDRCPFIWKNYSEQGYRTAYGEDAVWMGIFNYNKRGFINNPTDYYNNALTYRLEKQIGHHHMINCKMCYGPRLGFAVSLDYLQKMAATMDKKRRYFQFIWATSLFHDYLNAGKEGDGTLLETLQWFNNGGYLEDTVFILMSDHGIRWGGIRSTLQGKIEERMPFLYFVFPEWFKEQYRSAVSNLIRNKPRLTTPFDLHETLLDLLDLGKLEEESLKKRYKVLQRNSGELQRGISLFLPIPLGRTCKDAAIDDHWCVCQKSIPVKNTKIQIIHEAAEKVLEHINDMFTDFPQCSLLRLDRVLNAQIMRVENEKIGGGDSVQVIDSRDRRLKQQQFTCSVSIRTLPSKATFEATITRHTDGQWKVSGDVSRTNLYGKQSRCVTDYNMKKYCYCQT